jgi:hypothetical protein
LCCKLSYVFLRRGLLREAPGQHELGFEHGPAGAHPAIQGRRHPCVNGMLDAALHVTDGIPGIALIPAAVELLGHRAELDNEIICEVLRFDLAPLLAPQPQQGGLVVPHYDSGIRSADRTAAIY